MCPARRYRQPEPEPEQNPIFKTVLVIAGLLIGVLMAAVSVEGAP